MTTEDQHSIAFAKWLNANKIKFTHIGNENGMSWSNPKQAMILGAKLKRLGLHKGLPDYMMLLSQGALWVEMKDPKLKLKNGDVMQGWTTQKKRGGLSREQYDWIIALNATPGTQAAVCYGVDEAIKFVTAIQGIKKEQYQCQSYYDSDNVLSDCSCGKCL